MICCLCPTSSKAQTICNADGTVTFQYKNDQAKEVLVDVQFAGRNAMQRDVLPLLTCTPTASSSTV